MDTKRYHRETGLPSDFDKLFDSYIKEFPKITYSYHAKLETIRDRYNLIPVLTKEQLRREYCFEAYVVYGRIIKAVFQLNSGDYNYTYSVNDEGNVVTCWANAKDDSHRTLDKSVYATV
jgi:hypothetical protein